MDLAFEEVITSDKRSYFRIEEFGFYLQDYYARDWINNSMVFIEVNNLVLLQQKWNYNISFLSETLALHRVFPLNAPCGLLKL